MIALVLLALAAGAGLNPLPLLALLMLGVRAGLLRERRRPDSEEALHGSSPEQIIATLYLRSGRLRLRRRP